jgi:hypothetical protein
LFVHYSFTSRQRIVLLKKFIIKNRIKQKPKTINRLTEEFSSVKLPKEIPIPINNEIIEIIKKKKLSGTKFHLTTFSSISSFCFIILFVFFGFQFSPRQLEKLTPGKTNNKNLFPILF